MLERITLSPVPKNLPVHQLHFWTGLVHAAHESYYVPPGRVFDPNEYCVGADACDCVTAHKEMATYRRKYAAQPALALRMAVLACLTKLGALQVCAFILQLANPNRVQ